MLLRGRKREYTLVWLVHAWTRNVHPIPKTLIILWPCFEFFHGLQCLPEEADCPWGWLSLVPAAFSWFIALGPFPRCLPSTQVWGSWANLLQNPHQFPPGLFVYKLISLGRQWASRRQSLGLLTFSFLCVKICNLSLMYEWMSERMNR